MNCTTGPLFPLPYHEPIPKKRKTIFETLFRKINDKKNVKIVRHKLKPLKPDVFYKLYREYAQLVCYV